MRRDFLKSVAGIGGAALATAAHAAPHPSSAGVAAALAAAGNTTPLNVPLSPIRSRRTMKKIMTALCCTTLASLTYAGAIAHSLTVGEGFINPLGFHDATPTFSWKLLE